MPDRLVRLWRAYLARQPDLEDRAAFYLTQVAAILINVNKAKDARPALPSDLDPWFDPWNTTATPIAAQMAAMHRTLQSDPESQPES